MTDSPRPNDWQADAEIVRRSLLETPVTVAALERLVARLTRQEEAERVLALGPSSASSLLSGRRNPNERA